MTPSPRTAPARFGVLPSGWAQEASAAPGAAREGVRTPRPPSHTNLAGLGIDVAHAEEPPDHVHVFLLLDGCQRCQHECRVAGFVLVVHVTDPCGDGQSRGRLRVLLPAGVGGEGRVASWQGGHFWSCGRPEVTHPCPAAAARCGSWSGRRCSAGLCCRSRRPG